MRLKICKFFALSSAFLSLSVLAYETSEKRITSIEKESEIRKIDPKKTIYFAKERFLINLRFYERLDEHVEYLNDHPNLKVVIEGHADERGTPEHNIALGERRAKNVEDYLFNMGIDRSRLTSISYGEEKQGLKGRDETSFYKGRSVVLVF